MNKTQIRLMLDKQGFKVSTARIGDVAVSLGLGDNVNRSYADNEVKQIMDAIRQSQPTAQQAKGDRHAQTTKTAHNASTQDQASLATSAQNHLAAVQASLDKIAANRDTAIEQVSDTLAYLYSPQTFQAEVLTRTTEKLGIKQSDHQDQVLTLDPLGECFSSFASSLEYPAISPYSVAGCLPM